MFVSTYEFQLKLTNVYLNKGLFGQGFVSKNEGSFESTKVFVCLVFYSLSSSRIPPPCHDLSPGEGGGIRLEFWGGTGRPARPGAQGRDVPSELRLGPASHPKCFIF